MFNQLVVYIFSHIYCFCIEAKTKLLLNSLYAATLGCVTPKLKSVN